MVRSSSHTDSATEAIANANDAASNDEEEVGDEETSSKVHLATGDYRIIVSWLENEKNFAAVYGSKKMTVGGEPKMTKKQAFQVMADHLHKYSTTPKLPHLNSRNMEQRWKNHLAKFKKVLRMKHTQTGLGITIKEMSRGVTIDEKLESKCACFGRLKVLFGERPNIQASSTLEIGVPLGCTPSLPPRPRKASLADFGSSDDGSDAGDSNDTMAGHPNQTANGENNQRDSRDGSEHGDESAQLEDEDSNGHDDATELKDDESEVGSGDEGNQPGRLDLSSRRTALDLSGSDGDSDAEGAEPVTGDRRTGAASGLQEYYEAATAELEVARQEIGAPPSPMNERQQHPNTGKQTNRKAPSGTGTKRSKVKVNAKSRNQPSSNSKGAGATKSRGQSREDKSKQTAQQSRLSISDNFSRAMIIRQRNDKRRLDQFETEAAERKKARENDEAHREKQLEIEKQKLQDARKQEEARRRHEKELQYMKMLTVVIKEGKTPAEAKAYFNLLSDMSASSP